MSVSIIIIINSSIDSYYFYFLFKKVTIENENYLFIPPLVN